jgi:hypothetical protein
MPPLDVVWGTKKSETLLIIVSIKVKAMMMTITNVIFLSLIVGKSIDSRLTIKD